MVIMSAVAENTVVSDESPVQQEQPQQQVSILDMPVETENDALNCMVNFLHLAQRRGAFAIAESSKIYDCVKVFQRQQQQ